MQSKLCKKNGFTFLNTIQPQNNTTIEVLIVGEDKKHRTSSLVFKNVYDVLAYTLNAISPSKAFQISNHK
jgi:hypothetical protein